MTKSEQWQQHLNLWHESGLSQVAFCQQHNIAVHNFQYWRFKGSESLISYTPSTSDHHHTLLFYGLKWCVKPSAPTSHEYTKIDNLCMAT
ncbi:IS66 family insertion sequence element accessory protein TnpA [Thalassolituus oleivorans]|uniref:IS66 family insertion sequence element accessory protein TnpA n=1 Tax=Thalassolituus oleivorans TaxID=187493 RepID=UPI003C6F8ECA